MEIHRPFFSHLPVQIHRGGRDHIGLGVGHFGGSKLLAEFCAKPLLHYTLQVTSGLFADRVVVTRSAEATHFAQSHGVCTAFGGQVGAPAAFSRTFFAELCCLPAGQGGGAVLKAHPQLVRCVQAQRAEELLDIDTKEDLETMQRRILNDP